MSRAHESDENVRVEPLQLITKAQLDAIQRSRAVSNQWLARRHHLPVDVVTLIRDLVAEGKFGSICEAVEKQVPAGTRVRLDAPMNSGFQREPEVGEWGTVPTFRSDAGGKLFVDWDNGSNLALMPGDRVSRAVPNTSSAVSA